MSVAACGLLHIRSLRARLAKFNLLASRANSNPLIPFANSDPLMLFVNLSARIVWLRLCKTDFEILSGTGVCLRSALRDISRLAHFEATKARVKLRAASDTDKSKRRA